MFSSPFAVTTRYAKDSITLVSVNCFYMDTNLYQILLSTIKNMLTPGIANNTIAQKDAVKE
jgi:hypothetical protein